MKYFTLVSEADKKINQNIINHVNFLINFQKFHFFHKLINLIIKIIHCIVYAIYIFPKHPYYHK